MIGACETVYKLVVGVVSSRGKSSSEARRRRECCQAHDIYIQRNESRGDRGPNNPGL